MSTEIAGPVRVVDGSELPIPGIWEADPGHAEVGFWGRHLMITKVRGRFTDFEAVIDIGDKPDQSRLEVTIDMSSVNSGDATRDDHLRSADFLDVDRNQTATFTSTGVDWKGSEGKVTGDLTIKDVTRPLTLDVSFLGALSDPWGYDRAVFEATAVINREDWGLTWNQVLDSGGMLVSTEVHVEIHAELVKQAS